ncbi:hypothetical protein EDB85DRAFT_1562336 [Lactarius pseudohatsudake]|nr:hypothetical protein EDB85DRAFT_1562336 [Lactarius pseudohatsudake]
MQPRWSCSAVTPFCLASYLSLWESDKRPVCVLNQHGEGVITLGRPRENRASLNAGHTIITQLYSLIRVDRDQVNHHMAETTTLEKLQYFKLI